VTWKNLFGSDVETRRLDLKDTGYSLVYDQLSYWATTIGTNMIATVPVIGEPLLFLLRGGPNVNPNTLSRFYDFHIGGIFYQDDEPYKIVKLTKAEFDYEAMKDSGVRVNGKFILTAPAGTVFPLYRTTRAVAEQ
jgi:hypothetical protein